LLGSETAVQIRTDGGMLIPAGQLADMIQVIRQRMQRR
jgi:hypothetical protein